MTCSIYLALFITLLLAATKSHTCQNRCHQNDLETGYPEEKDQPNHSFITKKYSAFAVKLYRKLAADPERSPGRNLFISPFSISTALSLLTLGAKSKTKSQILTALGFYHNCIKDKQIHETIKLLTDNLSNDTFMFNNGNCLFIDKKVNVLKSFEEDVKRYYRADIVPVDFTDPQTIQHINDYMAEKTMKSIRNVLKELPTGNEMFLVNYIISSGHWTYEFGSKATEKETFTVNESTSVQVEMVNKIKIVQTCKHRDYADILKLSLSSNVALILAIPPLGRIDDLEATIHLKEIKGCMYYSVVNIFLPKFSISSKVSLEDILRGTGISDVFGHNADLSGISDQDKLKLSKVTVSAGIEVSENKIKAFDATDVTYNCLFDEHFDKVIVNKPFIVMIYSTQYNSLLYIGKVMNPNEN